MADPIIVVSESPRPAVQDRKSDAGRLEDSVKSWTREAVVVLRSLLRRVASLERAITSLQNVTPAAVVTPTAVQTVAESRVPESVSGTNLGDGVALFKDKVSATLRFRSLKAGTNIRIREVGDMVEISAAYFDQRVLEELLAGSTPTGVVQMWPAVLASIPAGWLLCDGSVLNIADYPDLAALLGTTYGGDGVTTFGVPDTKDRFPLGPAAAEEPGATGGTVQHQHGAGTLAADNVADHTHGFTSSSNAGSPDLLAADATAAGVAASGTTGAAGAHGHTISGKTDVNENLAASTATADVLPPFLKLAFIIKT